MSVSYCGPFYTKSKDGEYRFADMCKECAFGDEKTNTCVLSPCTYLFAVAEQDALESDIANVNIPRNV